MSKEKETEFKVKQRVVYPSQGVGTITEIVERPFRGRGELEGKNVKHYRIYIEVSDMTTLVPVQNVGMLGIRAIVPAKDAQEALDSLSIDNGPVTSDWKLRFQQNMDLLKKGSVFDIANIVRCLYQRSKVKELPIQERKLYDSATKLLIDEISCALEKSPEEIEAMILARLEPLGASVTKKSAQSNFDDDDDDDEFAEGENDSNDGEEGDEDSEDDDDEDDSDSDDNSDDDDDEDDDDEE